jgi:hypothetical protein
MAPATATSDDVEGSVLAFGIHDAPDEIPDALPTPYPQAGIE